MLFSQHEHPVFISPVYGCLITKEQHDFRAYPHVPSFKSVQKFPGLRDLEAGEYPSSFTVVPILALDTATFAQITYTGRNETHLGLCKKLIEFDPASWVNVKLLRGEPSLVVTGGATEVPPAWLEGYCASKALCVHHEADTPTTLNVLDVGWLFMLIVVISDATPATNGRPSLVLCVLNSMEGRCLLSPTILNPSRRLTKVRRTKVRSNRSLTEVC
jgi:hypothetical protein